MSAASIARSLQQNGNTLCQKIRDNPISADYLEDLVENPKSHTDDNPELDITPDPDSLHYYHSSDYEEDLTDNPAMLIKKMVADALTEQQQSMEEIFDFSAENSPFYEEINKINSLEDLEEQEKDETFDTVKNEAIPDINEILKNDECSNSDPKAKSMLNCLLYPGALITAGASLLIIFTFSMKHKLSGQALSDLLQLILLHCGSPLSTSAFNSLFEFKKYFQNITSPVKYHKYCSSCLTGLNSNDIENNICPNKSCLSKLDFKNAVSFFIEVPLVSQLQDLFRREGFYGNLQYRFRREKKTSDAIEDIYDGSVYQNLWEKGILNNPKNISFMWNTDGIPLFKSVKCSLWPMYLTINELDPIKRQKRENMLFAGLWFGPKPFMLTFLKPFFETLNELEKNGATVSTAEHGDILIKGFLLCGTADLPAKCLVCNSVQFNGYFGCLKCKQRGVYDESSRKVIFPFDYECPSGPVRDHAETFNESKTATFNNPVNGIKGPCWFCGLKYYDMIKGTAIDYMHCVLLGIMKMLLNMWFGSEHASAHYSHAPKVSEVDERLSQIKPPNNISRMPRSIEENLKYLKASELRSFLLYYGPAVLKGVLDDSLYEHFLLLSDSIHILLGSSITETELRRAAMMLQMFCLKVPILYGVRFSTANVHLLLHLVDSVKALGPLWTHSCFSFEDKNGYLLKLFHGTQNVAFQIVSAVSMQNALPQLAKDFIDFSSPVGKFYKQLTGQTNSYQTEIAPKVHALGYTQLKELTAEELLAFANYIKRMPLETSLTVFSRVKLIYNTGFSDTYTSKLYTRVSKRWNYFIQYKSNHLGHATEVKVGEILFFFQWKTDCIHCTQQHCNCLRGIENLAMVKTPSIILNAGISDNILGPVGRHVSRFPLECTWNYEVIPINFITSKNVYVPDFHDKDFGFVIPFPNKSEFES